MCALCACIVHLSLFQSKALGGSAVNVYTVLGSELRPELRWELMQLMMLASLAWFKGAKLVTCTLLFVIGQQQY